MSVPETIAVEGLDGSAAGRSEPAFRLVYAEVFAEAPYEESPASVEATFRRFRSQVRKSTFRAALARTAGGEPVGIAYGYPLGAATGWVGPSGYARRERSQARGRATHLRSYGVRGAGALAGARGRLAVA